METLSLSACTLFLLRETRRTEPEIYEVPGVIPLLLLLGYMLVQVVPLPPTFIKLLSPETYSLYAGTTGITGAAEWYSLSIHKKATLAEFFRIAAYTAFYILTVQLLTKKDLFSKTVVAVVVFGACVSILALLQHIFFNNKIFWIRELTLGGNPFGPYVNRNHYAGLMEMIFPIGLGMFFYYKPYYTGGPFRAWIAGIFSRRMTSLYILAGLAVLLMATSIFLSLSRGGILSLCLSLLVFGSVLVRKFGEVRKGVFIILLFMLILYTVGWFGWEPIFKRFAGIGDAVGVSELRRNILNDGMNIIRAFPLTGTGFGSFSDIYPKYSSSPVHMILEHAHNDYLELLAEGGFIGSLLFFWFLSSVVVSSHRVFMKRRNLFSVYLYTGSLAGLIAILLHSLTDFNLHIGANGLYFFFLAGLAVSAAHTTTGKGTDSTYLHKTRSPLLKYAGIFAAVVTLACVVFNTGILTADYYGSASGKGRSAGNISEKDRRTSVHRASYFDPLESKYPYALAGMEWSLSNRAPAIGAYEKAVRLTPTKGEYLQGLGWALSGPDKAKAARLFLAGIEYDRQNPARYSRYAAWLLEQGDREAGIGNFSKAISLEVGKTREYIALMVLHGLSDREIKLALPDLAGPHMDFADYLHSTQQEEMAGEEYLSSLSYIQNGKEPGFSFFYRAHKYYAEKKQFDKALSVMQKAVAALPEDAQIRLKTAQTYEEAGLVSRAVGEYKKVLILDPGNKSALKKLDELK
ncbi:MAG: hypothetical protein C0402_08240 [Thermodesulfovibrio sp.]|nr:hypothetical protein [Thermodesulfovibrio sp.]